MIIVRHSGGHSACAYFVGTRPLFPKRDYRLPIKLTPARISLAASVKPWVLVQPVVPSVGGNGRIGLTALPMKRGTAVATKPDGRGFSHGDHQRT